MGLTSCTPGCMLKRDNQLVEDMVKPLRFSHVLHQVMPPLLIIGGFCIAAVAASHHDPWGIATAVCMYVAAFCSILKSTP